jgi:hypothetical protein
LTKTVGNFYTSEKMLLYPVDPLSLFFSGPKVAFHLEAILITYPRSVAMMKKTLVGLIAVAGMLVSAATQATIIPWSSTIDSAQEVPTNASMATGSASGTIDNVSGALAWNISI